MEITQERNENELILHVAGRIDTKTAPELEPLVRTSLAGIEMLVFDLEGTTYISSAGLRIFLLAQKQMNRQGKMVVRHVNKDLLDIFEVTGFLKILTIEGVS